MLGWIITGIIFFLKPGYQGAYEQVSVKTYPLTDAFLLPASEQWQAAKLIKTILGYHLIVNVEGESIHLDPTTFDKMPAPNKVQFKALLIDALAQNKTRYGNITQINLASLEAVTDNNINVTLDWSNLKLRQQGDDTKRINLFYKIHYLQWTPNKTLNQIMGITGLLLLMLLTFLGIKLYLGKKCNNA